MGTRTMRALLSSGMVGCTQAFVRVLAKCISVPRVPSRRRWAIEMTVSDIDDVPTRIPKRRAYLIAASKLEKWLVFDCPCNSGHQIMPGYIKQGSRSVRLRCSTYREIHPKRQLGITSPAP